ncbi:MAG TPA: TPM domain-containing protein, partial [Chryseosolibacter sp.]
MRYLTLLLLVCLSAPLTAQHTVESVPNQKLINGSYVSDPDGILGAGTVAQIDTLLRSLEKRTTVQVAVVALQSIGDYDDFGFAQELFDNWGIGNKENDNGMLVLLVKDKHTIHFHTGYGLEGVLPDVVCKRIQRDYMVPEFRKDNYSGGMLAGLQEVNRILSDPGHAEELKTSESEVSAWVGFVIFLSVFLAPVFLVVFIVKSVRKTFSDSGNPRHTDYPEMRLSRWSWLLEFIGIPVAIVALFGVRGGEDAAGLAFLALYFYFMFTLFHRLWRSKKVIRRFLATQEYYEIVEFLRKDQWYWFFVALIFPIPFALYFFYHLARKRMYRNHPRKCKQCQGNMRKLDEKSDDEYLSEAQRVEEKLRSVDYDVWKCEACGSIEVWFYLNRHSKYESCPKCKT